MNPAVLMLALAAGLAFRRIGYPPLLGYLVAGFVAHALGHGDVASIQPIADLGVMLLLFTIGLKIQPQELARPQVWGVACLHMLIVTPLTAALIVAVSYLFPSLALHGHSTALTLAFALSFSSTVFAVKVFEERGESAALYANIAIGILVIQDVMAVIYLVATADHPPSLAALALLTLPLLRPLLQRLLQLAGHGELLVLFGIALALAASALFEATHLKGGLGALIAGMLLANAEKSTELYKSLVSLKDLFLIGFFLQIGYYGLPTAPMLLVALALGGLIFLRPLIYFLLLVAMRLRARTALFAGISLFNYSEFGLIVAAMAAQHGLLPQEWVTTLALAVALSFFIAMPFNTRAHELYRRFFSQLQRLERSQRLPAEQVANLGDADIVVLGMGRVGSGAYRYLQNHFGDRVIGVEENFDKARLLSEQGMRCVHGDAIDRDFWEQAGLTHRQLILVSLTNHSENLAVIDMARSLNYQNHLAVSSRYPDEQRELEALGCITFNLYAEAGYGFAEHALKQMRLKPGAAEEQISLELGR